jgi:SAM-dependent methyltransferase
MPAAPFPRQAAVSSWFDTTVAQQLLQAEQPLIMEALLARPAQPWLWLAPVPFAPLARELPGRGVRLHRTARGYAGDLVCTLPLPLPSESVNAIVLQHVLGADAAALLEECERVLLPGGRIWLFALNAVSPYRLRWRRQGLVARPPGSWRGLLERVGLPCTDPLRYLGPVWPTRGGVGSATSGAPLRAVCLLQAEKRTAAGIGPIPLRAPVRWRGSTASI